MVTIELLDKLEIARMNKNKIESLIAECLKNNGLAEKLSAAVEECDSIERRIKETCARNTRGKHMFKSSSGRLSAVFNVRRTLDRKKLESVYGDLSEFEKITEYWSIR